MLNALHGSTQRGRRRRWHRGLYALASVCALASCGGSAAPGTGQSAITQAAPGAGSSAVAPALALSPAATSSAVCDAAVPEGFARCHSRVRTDANGSVQAFATPAGLLPSDLQSAYDVPPALWSGATVAIVDAFDDPNAEADLGAYRTQFGLAPCTSANGCFRKINQRGQTSPLPVANSGWALEISLDLDMVSAICPTCKILLVEADTNGWSDLGTAVNAAAAAGATVISNSYGGGESSTSLTYDNSYFNHPGIAIFASTGDNGYGVAYPATSRNITAVGGTVLTKAPGTLRGWTETAWSGAGSGCSGVEGKPSWQRDLGCANRTIADVSAVADDVAVYDSYNYGGWLIVGGTSASSPIVASIYALTGRGGADPSFPYLNSTLFFDPDTGSNGSCVGSYLCTTGPGYDGPTGNGSPDAAMLAFGPPPGITFFESFYGDADIRQCNYAAYGTISAPIERWTPAVRIDTGSLAGGCIQEFAIQDPANELAGVTLNVDFEPDGDGQCDLPGPRNVPISARATGWTAPYRIDTDNRAGGCLQTFRLSGPDVVAFDVDFVPDGDPNNATVQCGNPGLHTITTGQSVTVRLNTDDQPGGCLERFRIRKR